MAEQKSGVRFWLKSTIKRPGIPDYRSDDPFAGVPGEISFPNISYNGKPLFIRGEILISDVGVINSIVKSPSIVRFNQADVDRYLASVSGKPVAAPAPVQEPVLADAPAPDVYVMTKKELVEYAGSQNIPVDVRKSKETLMGEVLAWLKGGNK